jgi:hypothetical protein
MPGGIRPDRPACGLGFSREGWLPKAAEAAPDPEDGLSAIKGGCWTVAGCAIALKSGSTPAALPRIRSGFTRARLKARDILTKPQS